jgi:cytochrome o ubiquinol oxidase subunit IV
MTTFSRNAYAFGFISSLALTLASYFAVVNKMWSGTALLILIFVLAFIQLFIQMIFFLHMGDKGERWKLSTYLVTVGGVLLIVVGSIWIMTHLNENMMASPELMHQYIEDQQAF